MNPEYANQQVPTVQPPQQQLTDVYDTFQPSAPPQQQQQQPYEAQYIQQPTPIATDSHPVEIAPRPSMQRSWPPQHTVQVTRVTPKVFKSQHGVQVICPNCSSEVITATYQRISGKQWFGCILLTLLGCFWGCCLIPFCIPSLKKTKHVCPKCAHAFN